MYDVEYNDISNIMEYLVVVRGDQPLTDISVGV